MHFGAIFSSLIVLQVERHPVLFELVRLRTVLERMRPIDKKLRYSVDKLLKTAHLGNAQSSPDPSVAALLDSYVSCHVLVLFMGS